LGGGGLAGGGGVVRGGGYVCVWWAGWGVGTGYHRGANGHRTAGGGGDALHAGGAIELQGFAGSHTRPARPPEASSPAGPPAAYIFWEGSCDKEEPPVVTEIGA
jgi:hypothetical protein